MLASFTFQDNETSPNNQDFIEALLVWGLIALCYHSMVVLCAWGGCKDLCENGPCWLQVSMHQRTINCAERTTGSDEKCRIARYFKCHKRQKRRSLNRLQCPLQSAIAKFSCPPPLPFHRRRKCCYTECTAFMSTSNQSIHAVPNQDDYTDTDTETDTDQSQERSFTELPSNDGPVLETPHLPLSKTKKKKTKKRSTQAHVASLIDLARMQHWSSILERVPIDSRDAQYQDADGLLPIHWACSGGPLVEVIEALLQAFPEGSSIVDSDGSTPLHFAAHYGGSAAVVEALLRVYPLASRVQDKYGRSPLYHAVEKDASMEVLHTLIRADPSMITRPCIPAKLTKLRQTQLEHRTPLYVVWATAMSDRLTRAKKSGRKWDKAQFLLRAAHAYHDSFIIYRMVHAAVAFDLYLPSEVLLCALELYPEHLQQQQNGKLPLAIAAESHQLSPQRSRELIELLLRHYSKAACVSRSALTLALETGKTWDMGVALLFQAAPDVLHRRDPTTLLLPALTAAAAYVTIDTEEIMPNTEENELPQLTFVNSKALEWQHHLNSMSRNKEKEKDQSDWSKVGPKVKQLSTVFELLRADPSVIQ